MAFIFRFALSFGLTFFVGFVLLSLWDHFQTNDNPIFSYLDYKKTSFFLETQQSEFIPELAWDAVSFSGSDNTNYLFGEDGNMYAGYTYTKEDAYINTTKAKVMSVSKPGQGKPKPRHGMHENAAFMELYKEIPKDFATKAIIWDIPGQIVQSGPYGLQNVQANMFGSGAISIPMWFGLNTTSSGNYAEVQSYNVGSHKEMLTFKRLLKEFYKTEVSSRLEYNFSGTVASLPGGMLKTLGESFGQDTKGIRSLLWLSLTKFSETYLLDKTFFADVFEYHPQVYIFETGDIMASFDAKIRDDSLFEDYILPMYFGKSLRAIERPVYSGDMAKTLGISHDSRTVQSKPLWDDGQLISWEYEILHSPHTYVFHFVKQDGRVYVYPDHYSKGKVQNMFANKIPHTDMLTEDIYQKLTALGTPGYLNLDGLSKFWLFENSTLQYAKSIFEKHFGSTLFMSFAQNQNIFKGRFFFFDS